MIIDTITKNTWNSNNKKYYTDKGYIFTKMYEEFDVKIEDLNPNSKKKIYDRIKNVSKKNVRDYIIATNEDGDFVPLNKKYENIISRDSYVGNLYDLYNRMVNNAQPMGNDFFEKGKDNVINKNKI
jgi:inhibitor of KinA sporulation pathway (predicted exonuclease)